MKLTGCKYICNFSVSRYFWGNIFWGQEGEEEKVGKGVIVLGFVLPKRNVIELL